LTAGAARRFVGKRRRTCGIGTAAAWARAPSAIQVLLWQMYPPCGVVPCREDTCFCWRPSPLLLVDPSSLLFPSILLGHGVLELQLPEIDLFNGLSVVAGAHGAWAANGPRSPYAVHTCALAPWTLLPRRAAVAGGHMRASTLCSRREPQTVTGHLHAAPLLRTSLRVCSTASSYSLDGRRTFKDVARHRRHSRAAAAPGSTRLPYHNMPGGQLLALAPFAFCPCVPTRTPYWLVTA
jgi:hypothetical protein